MIARLAIILAIAYSTLSLAAAQRLTGSSLYNYPPSATTTTLPTCNAGAIGAVYIVTNALTPALGLTVVGGGAVSVVVKCNGTNWLVGQ